MSFEYTTVSATENHYDNISQSVPPPTELVFLAALTSEDLESSIHNPTRRKPGRPRKDRPPAQQRPVGRPPGTGKNQRAAAEASGSDLLVRRKPGRPPKNTVGEVSVTFAPGKFLVPARPSQAALRLGQSTTLSNMAAVLSTNQPPLSTSSSRRIDAQTSTQQRPVSTVTERPIIEFGPEEDPEREIDDGDLSDGSESDEEESERDHTMEDEAIGDGIGVDEEYSADPAGGEDEHDPNEATIDQNASSTPGLHAQSNTSTKKNPAEAAWLREIFETLATESKIRINGKPALYENHNSFWFPRRSGWFILQKDNITPRDLYNPRFFLWDPIALVQSIGCPHCKHPLIRHGMVAYPRRCIGLDEVFYMIGFRYRCTQCRNPRTNRVGTVTFPSWSSLILKMLPKPLAEEFPVQFTRRSGVCKSVLRLMRSCFQNGMGAKGFSDCIRIQHLERYDHLQIQYYHTLVPRVRMEEWRGERKFEVFLPYDDVSSAGLHGFVPNATYFRTLYDRNIMEHRAEILQHTSMLSLEVGSVDHSFKTIEQIARAHGEKIFNGLLTITNENGEIRTCHLVTTTGHSQSSIALDASSKSLTTYGRSQPKAFYTDNVQGDRQLLESSFESSLLKELVRIEPHGHLEILRIPDDVQVRVIREEREIDLVCSRIIGELQGMAEGEDLVVGFDSEWNVDFVANDRFQHHGPTSIVQLAYKDTVYILQIGDLIAQGRLPLQLRNILEHERIRKVGRLVKTDFKHLQSALPAFQIAFSGDEDLAQLAKRKCVFQNIKNVTLADLSARVLHRRLNKNVAERTSSWWENPTLNQDQINYAALDAYASLRIFQVIDSLQSPRPITSLRTITSDLPVLIYPGTGSRRSFVASGVISAGSGEMQVPENVHVKVTRVYCGAAQVPSQRSRSYEDYGPCPFVIPIPRSLIVTYQPLPEPPAPMDIVDDAPLLNSSDAADDSIPHPGPSPPPPEHPEGYEVDHEALQLGRDILGGAPPARTTRWERKVRSRVIKDAFHAMHMIQVSRRHGLHKEFSLGFSDMLFIPVEEDAARLATHGAAQNPPTNLTEIRRRRRKWYLRHCRRRIPPPEILYPRAYDFFMAFGALKDAATGAPLFNETLWKIARSILDLIERGFLSDPPGVPLYATIGITGASDLPAYRCFRGTNTTEGGVHTHLRPHLPTSGASIEHIEAALLDFVLHHNLVVGTFNTTGQRYKGHFSIWLINEIDDLKMALADVLVGGYPGPPSPGWINGNWYKKTSEVPVGVLPVPKDVRERFGLDEYAKPGPGTRKPPPYNLLAELQGTKMAVLPVHTRAEEMLYREMIAHATARTGSTVKTPSWTVLAKEWNKHASIESEIYYKLPEQLSAHYGTYKTNLNVQQSLASSVGIRRPVLAELQDLSVAADAPPAPPIQPHPHDVVQGFINLDPHAFNHDAPETAASSQPQVSTSSIPSLPFTTNYQTPTVYQPNSHVAWPPSQVPIMFSQPTTSSATTSPSSHPYHHYYNPSTFPRSLLPPQQLGMGMSSGTVPAGVYSALAPLATANQSSLAVPSTQQVQIETPWEAAARAVKMRVYAEEQNRQPAAKKPRKPRHCVKCGNVQSVCPGAQTSANCVYS